MKEATLAMIRLRPARHQERWEEEQRAQTLLRRSARAAQASEGSLRSLEGAQRNLELPANCTLRHRRLHLLQASQDPLRSRLAPVP